MMLYRTYIHNYIMQFSNNNYDNNYHVNYDADNEFYDNEDDTDIFINIEEYIDKIVINYDTKKSFTYDDEPSIDVFIAIGEYIMDQNMKYNLALDKSKKSMANVIKQINENNKTVNEKVKTFFYISSDDREISSSENKINKYTDTDDLFYHDN